MQQLYFFLLFFFFYAFIGWCAEVAFAAWKSRRFVNRGFLNGPVCPIYGLGVSLAVQLLSPYQSSIPLLFVVSVILCTALEWFTGFLLEKLFHSKWWDYSHLPLNLNGYVCLPFSLLWGVACVLIVKIIHPLVYQMLALIPVPLGVVLLVIFCAVLAADLAVTASSILKLNRQLEKLEEITAELHQISDHIGESIYERTTAAIEKQEELKETFAAHRTEAMETVENVSETMESVSAEMRERIAGLREKSRQLAENLPPVQLRLLRAFPRMENQRHRQALEDLRKRLKQLEKRR